ncbi:MAG: hypothetical protein Ta2E_08250 [Mycoplasmoidaceae bacterium]|nr:MAG: hypothetical protein Ta2E_08250 [Mycoplasmoidaceae bacterium]
MPNCSEPVIITHFHIPNTEAYEFYRSGRFIREYCENAKTHKPRDGMSEMDFVSYDYGKYMKDEAGHGGIKIPTCQSENGTNGKIAKDSIVFDSIISISEEDTKNIGLAKSQQNITEYFFNQFCESHKFKKEDWSYFSALHTNTDNDHLHVVFYQNNKVEEAKIIKSSFLEAVKFKKASKDSEDFKFYLEEHRKVFTSQKCINNTKNHLFSLMDQSMDSDVIRGILKSINENKIAFNTEIKKAPEKHLLELARDVEENKGKDGRLQYNNLTKWANTNNPEWKAKNDKMKLLVKKVDNTVNSVISNDKDLSSRFKLVDNKLRHALNLDSKDFQDPQKHKLHLSYYEKINKELKANLGNSVLNECKKLSEKEKDNRMSSSILKSKKLSHAKFKGYRSSPEREYVYKEKEYTKQHKKSILGQMLSYATAIEKQNIALIKKLGDEWIEQQMKEQRIEEMVMGM